MMLSEVKVDCAIHLAKMWHRWQQVW